MSTYYHPELKLEEVDAATNRWKLTTKIFYPAGESGRETANQVVLSTREILIEVEDNPSFKSDHYVTFSQTFTRQSGENEVEVTVAQDGKKKGKGKVLYKTNITKAA